MDIKNLVADERRALWRIAFAVKPAPPRPIPRAQAIGAAHNACIPGVFGAPACGNARLERFCAFLNHKNVLAPYFAALSSRERRPLGSRTAFHAELTGRRGVLICQPSRLRGAASCGGAIRVG
jgi:hypothetical protein